MWPRPLYLAEADRQLSDGKFYERLDHNPINSWLNQRSTRRTMQTTFLYQRRIYSFLLQKPEDSISLPKIHKPNNPGRPIVSVCSCPTENIASCLDHLMRLLVRNLGIHVKDTNRVPFCQHHHRRTILRHHGHQIPLYCYTR